MKVFQAGNILSHKSKNLILSTVSSLNSFSTTFLHTTPECSSVLDHRSTVKAENGYESVNYETMMMEMHGCWVCVRLWGNEPSEYSQQ